MITYIDMGVLVWVVFIEDLEWETVERDKISQFLSICIFNHVSLINSVFGYKSLANLFLWKLGCNRELSKMLLKETIYLWDIFCCHLSEVAFAKVNLGILLYLVSLHVICHALSRVEGTKAYLNQFLWIDTTVIISCSWDRSWDNNSSCENCLVDPWEIDSSS